MSSIKELRLKTEERLNGIFGPRLNPQASSISGAPAKWIHNSSGGMVGASEETFTYLKVNVLAKYSWADHSITFTFQSYDHRVQNYLSSLGEGATPEEVAEFLKMILEV